MTYDVQDLVAGEIFLNFPNRRLKGLKLQRGSFSGHMLQHCGSVGDDFSGLCLPDVPNLVGETDEQMDRGMEVIWWEGRRERNDRNHPVMGGSGGNNLLWLRVLGCLHRRHHT